MKPKTLILMVVAISCGLGASYMTSRLLADRQQDVEKVSVLVAKKTLNMGESMKIPEDLFEIKEFAKGEEPKQAILDAETLKSRILKRSLRTGDFITPDDLLDENNPGVPYQLPQGHQAVGIRVSSETIAGGLASLPHSKVNIISTVRRGDDSKSYARILLENVLVLAADGSTKIIENGQPMPANVVTVALKPEDVLKLELAKTMGTISLALRKYNDNSKSEFTKVTAETLNTNTGAEDEDLGLTSAPPTAVVPVAPVAAKDPAKEPAPKVNVAAPAAPPRQVGAVLIYNGPAHSKIEYEVSSDQEPSPAAPPSK